MHVGLNDSCEAAGGRRLRAFAVSMAVVPVIGVLATPLLAVDATWATNNTGNWIDAARWSTNPDVPGAASPGTTSTDIATIGSAVNGKTITVDAGRNIGSITFSANAGAVTLSGGSLVLTAGGVVQVTGAGSGADSILSPISLQGNYTFTGSSTPVSSTRQLVIGGGVSGVATAGNTTLLTLNGSNTGDAGANTYNRITNAGVLNDGAGGGALSIVKADAGSWALNAGLSATTASTYATGASSITFTSLPAGIAVGNRVFGSGIAPGTTVAAVNPGTFTVTLSTPTTAASNTSGVQFVGYSGGVRLDQGKLFIGNSAALGAGALTINGGTLGGNLTVATNNDQIWAGNFNYGDANSTLNLGTGAVSLGVAAGVSRSVTVNNANGSLTVGGAISGGTGVGTANSLTKAGAGTLNLSSNANTFADLLITGGIANASTVINGTGSTYASPFNLGTPFGAGTLTLNGGGIRLGVSGGATGNVTNYGVSTQDIVLAGSGSLNAPSTARAVVMYSGLISGPGVLTLTSAQGSTNDPSGIVLQHTNTYVGGTELNTNANATSARALFVIDAPNALGSGPVSFINNNTAIAPLTAPAYLTLKADQTIAGLSSARGKAFVTGSDPATLRTLTISNTADGPGDDANYVGVIGAGALPGIAGIVAGTPSGNNLRLVKEGTGTQVLSGLSTYAGGTVVNGGTLLINGGATEAPVTRTGSTVNWTGGSAPATSSVVSNIDTTGLRVGQFVFGTSNSVAPQIVSIDSAANSIVLSAYPAASSGGTVSLSFSALSSAVSQNVVTSGSTATGSSSLTLASVAGLAVGQFISATNVPAAAQITSINTATNTITLSAVTTNTISSGAAIGFVGTSGAGSGAVTVNAGGTLGGNGGIAGDVVINGNGHISPGNSIGTLTTGSLTMAASAIYDAELDFSGEGEIGGSDAIRVNGNVALNGGTLALQFSSIPPTVESKTFVLIINDGSDAVSGILSLTPPAGFESLSYSLIYDYNADGGAVGNDVALVVAVPEPGSLVAMAMGGLSLLRRRRKKG